MITQKFYLLLENLDQSSDLGMDFETFFSTFEGCLFQLNVFLKLDFSSCNCIALSLVDRVTTGK